MKRNKSVDDVFSFGLYEDDDFFNQMGSRSFSFSRENVILFIVVGVDFVIFDFFQIIRIKFFDLFLGGNGRELVFLDLFDLFSFKSLSLKFFDEFDFFGVKLGQGSSSIEVFLFLSINNGGLNLNLFDLFGKIFIE